MPTPNTTKLVAARQLAESASAIGEAAQAFRQVLNLFFQSTASRANIGFTVSNSRTGVVLNFAISTVHGSVEAIFDHVLRNDALIGRYQFFYVQETATGEAKADEIWTMLFDANCNATWDPEGNFEWRFAPGGSETEGMMGYFILTLLGKIQDKLPRY